MGCMAADADQSENIRISDPRALKALAHPARNKILERLQVYGPATATECAAVAGMSPSACSYHLRLLQRYGFVEAGDAGDRRDGRERLWKAVVRGWTSQQGPDADPQEMQAIDMALARVLLASSDEKVLSWVDRSAQDATSWREASLISNSTIVATVEELKQIQDQIQGVLKPYLLRDRDPDELPTQARLVHAAVRLTPAASTGASKAPAC
jgi:DNA-binding transcriptional ArsR family regulator